MKALTPQEAYIAGRSLPSEVLDAVNTLITNNWNAESCSSTWFKSSMIQLIQEKMLQAGKPCTREHVINDKYEYEIELAYKAIGWKISSTEMQYRFSYKHATYL